GDRLLGEVPTVEAAVGEGGGHQVDGVALAAAHVARVDPGGEAVDDALGQGQDHVDERGVGHVAARGRHHRLELRVLRVGHAAAVAEAGDDVVLDGAHQRLELRHAGEVVGPGRPRQ